MTLLEAYRAIGPLVGLAAVDAARSEAAAVLLDELQRICRRLRLPVEIKEELPSLVLLKLMRGAAGGRSWSDPTTEAGVRGWLATCLENFGVSEVRKRRLTPPLEDAPEKIADRRGGLQPFHDEEQTNAEAGATWCQLLEEIVPEIARGLLRKRAEDFQRSVRELLALAREQTTIEAVVAAQGRKPGTQSHAAVYQQHHRARVRLMGRIEEMEAARELDADRARHLRNAVRFLRRRA